jgi:hypothetical protein
MLEGNLAAAKNLNHCEEDLGAHSSSSQPHAWRCENQAATVCLEEATAWVRIQQKTLG